MGRTLELINEWKNGIATASKHKEDLVHIRDMWRLLGYKGYRFPELSRNAAIAVATDVCVLLKAKFLICLQNILFNHSFKNLEFKIT